MDYFENIEIGDSVMVNKTVSYGWNQGKSFWVPQSVTHVTAKRFEVGDHTYLKSNGFRYGETYASPARMLGDLSGGAFMGNGSSIVTDETNEYIAFVEHITQRNYINKTLSKLSVSIDDPEMEKVYDMVKELESILNPS